MLRTCKKGQNWGKLGGVSKKKNKPRKVGQMFTGQRKIKENSEARTAIRKIFLGKVWRKIPSVGSRQKG